MPGELSNSRILKSETLKSEPLKGEMSSEKWVPLLDFAVQRGISLSTLRRRIKANKVRYKLENGRYLIFDHETREKTDFRNANAEQGANLQSKLRKLETDLKKAQIEIAELKTLIALYEEKLPNGLDN